MAREAYQPSHALLQGAGLDPHLHEGFEEDDVAGATVVDEKATDFHSSQVGLDHDGIGVWKADSFHIRIGEGDGVRVLHEVRVPAHLVNLSRILFQSRAGNPSRCRPPRNGVDDSSWGFRGRLPSLFRSWLLLLSLIFLLLLGSIPGDKALKMSLGDKFFNFISQLAAIIGVMPRVPMVAAIQMSAPSLVRWGSDSSWWSNFMSSFLDVF